MVYLIKSSYDDIGSDEGYVEENLGYVIGKEKAEQKVKQLEKLKPKADNGEEINYYYEVLNKL